ncbi:helix-turn-helix domain-containing protein [Mycobacterium kansasii]
MSIDNDARTGDPPLDHDAAEKLDQRIQRMADTAARNLDTLAGLLSEAQAGHIHEALGFSSWTEYVADRLKPITKALGREELRALTVQLYDAGMSVRDTADATGQSKSTVQREVSQSGTVEGSADATVGHDGKIRARKRDTDPEQHRNGGPRGKWEPSAYASRAKSYIGHINGDAELPLSV